jgi:CRP-like cAMP-binding protein
MQPEAPSRWLEAVAPHPLAELLRCPPSIESRLNGSAECIDFHAGDVAFRQSSACMGLYVVISGLFQRKTERLGRRLTLSPARPGDLVELSAALGDAPHTYTLTALVDGSMLLLPAVALSQAFEAWPRLRMKLLEELAREVSRGYNASRLTLTLKSRRRSSADGEPSE